jgi:amidohydrolase
LYALFENIESWVIDVRRDLHSHPELGFEEYYTSNKVKSLLKDMGIEYYESVQTGVVGIIRGGHSGKTVGLRADMDALPITEENHLPFKSQNPGRMHACGHDAHTAILLGTAKVLSSMKKELHGNIKLIFQPGEETTGGAKPMIEDGVLENPHVDCMFGLHVSNDFPAGSIGIKYNKAYAASDMFDIIIRGKSSHGASPELGTDAIIAAASVASMLQTVVSRNISPLESAVVTIGTINGGTARNVICDRVEMSGIIRTLTPEIRQLALNRVKTIVETAPKALGATGEFIRHESYTCLINNDSCVDIVKSNGEKILGTDKVHIVKQPQLGVEDFAYFAEAVPSAFFFLGCRKSQNGEVFSAHNPRFDINEACLMTGVKMQVANVLSVLQK